jgi:hypothetical protein
VLDNERGGNWQRAVEHTGIRRRKSFYFTFFVLRKRSAGHEKEKREEPEKLKTNDKRGAIKERTL